MLHPTHEELLLSHTLILSPFYFSFKQKIISINALVIKEKLIDVPTILVSFQACIRVRGFFFLLPILFRCSVI